LSKKEETPIEEVIRIIEENEAMNPHFYDDPDYKPVPAQEFQTNTPVYSFTLGTGTYIGSSSSIPVPIATGTIPIAQLHNYGPFGRTSQTWFGDGRDTTDESILWNPGTTPFRKEKR